MQRAGWVCAGLVVSCSLLKYLVVNLSAGKRKKKEAPMRHAFMLGIRSVSETLWTIGTSYIAAGLPG
jgi:hypothetical protein